MIHAARPVTPLHVCGVALSVVGTFAYGMAASTGGAAADGVDGYRLVPMKDGGGDDDGGGDEEAGIGRANGVRQPETCANGGAGGGAAAARPDPEGGSWRGWTPERTPGPPGQTQSSAVPV